MPPESFLIDANLPPLLAKRLEAVGYPAVHVFDRLRPDARDVEIAAHANRMGAVVMTKDSDFIGLLERGVLQTALVRLSCGNVNPARLWAIVEPALPSIAIKIAAGHRFIELS